MKHRRFWYANLLWIPLVVAGGGGGGVAAAPYPNPSV